jgi:hypothetical protein
MFIWSRVVTPAWGSAVDNRKQGVLASPTQPGSS